MMIFSETGSLNQPEIAIANRIRKRREALGLSRKSVAESSGIHLSSVTRWERRGVPAYMSRSTDVRRLERALKVSAGWVFSTEHPAEGDEPQISPEASLQARLRTAGDRARMLRETLGIARNHLALRLEVRDVTLRQWENAGVPHSLGADKIDAWEKALQVEPGWLMGKDPAAPSVSLQPLQAGPAAANRTAAQVILEAGRILALATPKTAERNAALFAARYGVNGGGRTLATVASEYGITESRACQILGAMRKRASELPAEFAGTFDLLDATAKQHLPCTPEHLETALRPQLGEGLLIEDAWRFAMDILEKPLLSLETHLYDDSAVAPVENERTAIVRQMAQSMITAVGAAHVGVLMGYAIELGWSIEAVGSIREVIQKGQGFEWLDRRERKNPEWFWYGESLRNNPVIVALRRVSSVADAPIVADVAMGAVERIRELRLSREERCATQYPVPPWFVTTAILARAGFLAGAPGRYRPATPLDPKSELTEQEYRLYSAFKRYGPTMSWETLAADLVDTGEMNEMTLRGLLSRSPIVVTQSLGVYTLRGASPCAAPAESMAA